MIGKLYSNDIVPANLKNIFTENKYSYNLRNSSINTFSIPNIGVLNNFGEKTFHYFFNIFINKFCKNNLANDFLIPFNLFKTRTINNVNLNHNLFISTFYNFNLIYVLC